MTSFVYNNCDVYFKFLLYHLSRLSLSLSLGLSVCVSYDCLSISIIVLS